jgi:hypothetical protein
MIMAFLDRPERSSDTSLVGIGLLVLVMAVAAVPQLSLALDKVVSLLW